MKNWDQPVLWTCSVCDCTAHAPLKELTRECMMPSQKYTSSQHFFYSFLHFHLSIHAKLSQGLLFMWLYRSWCHLNHFLAVSLTLLSFTAKAWKYFCTSSIPSHSLFYSPPFLPAPEKLMLFVMIFCPPPASVHSLPPPPTHQPLASISCLSVDQPKAKKEDRFHSRVHSRLANLRLAPTKNYCRED